jgi:hypothetical protein
VSGVGILIARHLDDIGPLTLALLLAAASAACYAWAWFHRREPVLLDEYLLLLASLLLSADAGYLEHQFHLFGGEWMRQFLLLAIVHGIVAYLFESRTVLGLSIAALAAYLGIERNLHGFERGGLEIGIRAFVCAVLLLLWRALDRRWHPRSTFGDLFAHVAANLAFWGALLLTFDDRTRYVGAALVIGIGIAAALYSFRTGQEAFLLYAYVYAVVAADRVILGALESEAMMLLYLIVSSIAAIVGLFVAYAEFRSRRARAA